MSALLIINLLYVTMQKKQYKWYEKKPFYALAAIGISIFIDGIVYYNYFKLLLNQ